MAIKKIIVEMNDPEVTFHEFNSIDEFLSSELYKNETEVVTDAEVIAEPQPEPEVVTPTE